MISCLRFTASHLSAIVRRPTKTRRCFTQKKTEVRLHCSISGNYCKAARAFDINESTVRGMIDVRPLPDKMKLSSISKICERDCVVRSSGSEKKTSDCCFVSHRWTNASTHDYFQRKNWANYLCFKHPSWFYCQNTIEDLPDDNLTKVWIERVWLKHTQAVCKRLGF